LTRAPDFVQNLSAAYFYAVLGVILHASSGYNGGRHEEHCSFDFGSAGDGFGGVRRRR
jgi:hypothetical protein